MATHICLCSRATEGLGKACPQVSLSSTVNEESRITQVLREIPHISPSQQMVTIRDILSNSQVREISALKEVQVGRPMATVILSHRGDQLTQSSTQTDQHSYPLIHSEGTVHQLNKRSKVVIIADVKLVQSLAHNISQFLMSRVRS